jgi:parallel beta-helix repeat protein
MISSLLSLLPIGLQKSGEHQSTAVLPGLRVQRYRWAMLVRLASSLLLGTTLLLTAKLDPGWAQTSLDTGITGEQTLPQAPPLPDNRPAIFVDAANGSDTRGDGSRNNPFKTITYAIQRAEAGSVIQLFPGVYSEESGETFPIRLKAGLTLRGDESTLGEGYLITGGGTYMSPTLGRQNVALLAETGAEVRGITLRNQGRRGYALWVESASPRILNNSFVGSIHDGIFIAGASNPWVEGNRFYKNGANGISVLGTSQPTIVNNLFQETGFGLTIDQRSAPVVRNNRILQNRTGVVVGGSSRPILRNNLIAQNLETGLTAITNAQPDLGTATDPGNNIFEGNGQYDINNATRGLRLNANGNQLRGQVKGDLDLSGQTTVAALPDSAPRPIAPGTLALPSAPAQPATPRDPRPAAETPSTLPVVTVPQSTDPSPVASLSGSGGRVLPNVPAQPADTQPQAQEFVAVPFTPDGSTAPAQPVGPAPAAPVPRPPSAPLTDITTLLPPPARRSSAGIPATPSAPTTTPVAPPVVAVGNDSVSPTRTATQFRVLVTPKSSDDLNRLRQLIPEAVETVFNGRTVLQAGLYDSRSQAQSVLDRLLDAGFEAVAEMIFR